MPTSPDPRAVMTLDADNLKRSRTIGFLNADSPEAR